MILEQFPFDLRVQIELLSRRRDILNKTKQEELLKLLRNANIENITQLGSGTNRYAFKMNGFVVKVATDNDGKIDNLKEMKMAKRLYPDVTKIYEVSENGTLLVAEYIQPFQSFGEMIKHQERIKEKLRKISQVYLIGDVGIDAKNYANWGTRIGAEDDPVCLDFAYIYDAKSELFICGECNTNSMLIPNADYTQLVCPNPACGHKYNFEDIRGRMSNAVHEREIGDLSEEAYKISESKILTELTPDRSNYLRRLKMKSKPVKEKSNEEEIPFDNFVFKKEEVDMTTINAIAILADGMNIYPNNTAGTDEGVAFSGNIGDTPVIEAVAVPIITENKKTYEQPIPLVEANVVPDETTPDVPGVQFSKTEEAAGTGEPMEGIEVPVGEEGTLDTTEEAAEEIITTEAPKEEVVEETEGSGWHPKESFKADFNRCLTKLASKIQQSLYDMDLFTEVKEQYIAAGKQVINGLFYTEVQSAVYHAFTKWLRMRPIKTDDKHTEWVCKKFEGSDAEPSMIFMERWFNAKRYNDNNDGAAAGMALYREENSDYLGLQRDWLDLFARNMKNGKLNIDPDGIEYVKDIIAQIWCTPLMVFEKKIEDVVEKLEDKGLINNDDGMLSLTDKGKEELTVPETPAEESFESDDEMLAFSGDVLSKIDGPSAPVPEEMEYLTDDEDEVDALNDLEVVIYPNENYDVIRLKLSDSWGNIEIPFYKKLADIDSTETIPSLADPRNGNWDWLIHTTPDMMFTTDDPDSWLELNNDDEYDDTVKFVILDPDYNGHTVVGMYAVKGIFVVDENGNTIVNNDAETLKRLDILFKSEIGNGPVSYYTRALNSQDLFRDEKYAKMVLAGYIEDDEDENGGEPAEEPVEEPEESEELGVMEPIHRKFN